MLVHIDNGLMAVVQACFPNVVISKYDMHQHTDILSQVIYEWCVQRIKEGNCTADAKEYLAAWEEDTEDTDVSTD